jgi:hypothetical protein
MRKSRFPLAVQKYYAKIVLSYNGIYSRKSAKAQKAQRKSNTYSDRETNQSVERQEPEYLMFWS